MKESFNMWKESNSHRLFFVYKHGRRGPTCNTRTSPLMQKKKKKETPQSILYYSIHRDEGVQEVEGGEGDLKDAWEAREIWEFTQQCSVSRSRKRMRCSHVNREGTANARYGGDCLAPPYPSFLSCRILIKSLLISTLSVYTSIYHITEVNCLGDSFPVVPLISWLGKYLIISTENI